MIYKQGKLLFFLTLIISVLSGCWPQQEKKNGLLVINVLDQELYNDCHIAGSINVPFDMIEECAATFDKDADLVIYCSNYQCSTSEYAARKFLEMGFKKVCVYEGGTAEWFQNGLPIKGPHKQLYLHKICQKPEFDSGAAISVISIKELVEKMGIQADQKRAA